MSECISKNDTQGLKLPCFFLLQDLRIHDLLEQRKVGARARDFVAREVLPNQIGNELPLLLEVRRGIGGGLSKYGFHSVGS
ncbi:hypothetical protein AW736_11990 [Termitidicoccus mucosus]|uniref:Uncharacterized protein n=1 Tax=Termitidicoccus mucosus TaxID=1184151 RepID=A0A178IKB6_9BACT|nr:hypothetical protein AW736_11990 [Opitutaceae bacterium TSB47]